MPQLLSHHGDSASRTDSRLASFLRLDAVRGLLSFSFLSFAGLITLPLGAILLGLLIRYAPDRDDRWGLVAGVGRLLLLIGVLNLNSSPCAEEGWVTVNPGEESYSCGGLNPWPWLVAGALIVGTAIVIYRRRQFERAAGRG